MTPPTQSTTPRPAEVAEARLRELMSERILVLDGATGTMIQRRKLVEADYRGSRFADWSCELTGNKNRCQRSIAVSITQRQQ